MELLRWCLVAATICSAFTTPVDVEKTIQQVQTILKANSELPRLSRQEIIELLNDIRAEDAKSKSSSTEYSRESSTEQYKTTNSRGVTQPPNIEENFVLDENDFTASVSTPTKTVETTTKREPSVMVVLPYTPRDGASLQELYTKAPRVEVMPLSKVTPKPFSESEKIQEALKSNAKIANQNKLDIPAELQAFLDKHGLRGKPGQDNFLLPLDGFKPLPPAKVVDGTVQLPENILLTYDLIDPTTDLKQNDNIGEQSQPPHKFLYEPLRPEYPFELETSSSEEKKSVLPLDLPKTRITKSTPPTPFAPIDYDSIKVIPLNKGPNPEDESVALEFDVNKRQTNKSSENQTTEVKVETTTADSTELKTNAPADDSAAADSDSGPSVADLEDSFGGAAPEVPGDSELPPPRKNGFYWMVDWNSFLEVGDGDTKVNIRFEPKLGDPQMFLPVNVP